MWGMGLIWGMGSGRGLNRTELHVYFFQNCSIGKALMNINGELYDQEREACP